VAPPQQRSWRRYAPVVAGLALVALVVAVGMSAGQAMPKPQEAGVGAMQQLEAAESGGESCSDMEEDCSVSKCCKNPGQTCYKKNKYWATCLDSCAPGKHKNDDDPEPWSCEALGERTKFPPGCSWPGADCSEENTCCNLGYACVRKNSYWAACVQVKAGDKTVPIPAGWNGTILGKWREEYETQLAVSNTLSGNTLFCLMAVLPGSYEMALVDTMRARKASIFGCEGYKIYHSTKSKMATWGTGVKTLVNTATFVKIWDQVKEDGQYLLHDWTVKVDADCVWFPARLRMHIDGMKAPAYTRIYLKNTLPRYTNGGFLGAIEIFSKTALETYLDNAHACVKNIGENSGEDGFLKDCMDALGIGYLRDDTILNPSPLTAVCQMGEFVAFHPLKTPENWISCYDIAAGNVATPPKMRLGSIVILPKNIMGRYLPPNTPPAKLAAAAQIAGVPVPALPPPPPAPAA